MHRTHEQDGLAVVSLDMMPDELKDRARVEEFLKQQGADFPNFIFDDTPEAIDAWLARHRFESSPTIILFDRNGKLAQVIQDPDDEKVEAEVKVLLEAK